MTLRLRIMHDFAAKFDPAFKASEQEIALLAESYADFRQYYDPPKTTAAIEALGILAMVVYNIEQPKVSAALRNHEQRRRTAAALKKTGGTSNPAAPVVGNPFAMPPSGPMGAGNVVQMPGV